jgi:hypothetical protein
MQTCMRVKYSLTILTSVLDGNELSASRSGHFTGKERAVPIGSEVGCVSEPA